MMIVNTEKAERMLVILVGHCTLFVGSYLHSMRIDRKTLAHKIKNVIVKGLDTKFVEYHNSYFFHFLC